MRSTHFGGDKFRTFHLKKGWNAELTTDSSYQVSFIYRSFANQPDRFKVEFLLLNGAHLNESGHLLKQRLLFRAQWFFFSSFLLTPKHLAVKKTCLSIKKQLFSPFTARSTTNFPFWLKKKKQGGKKNKAELPWKLWIAACVSQAWWLKLHSAATSYQPPCLLKVCATSAPDLHSAQSPTMRLTLVTLHKWGFWQDTQRIPSGRMVSIKTFLRLHVFLPSAIQHFTHQSHLTSWLYLKGKKKERHKLLWNAAHVRLRSCTLVISGNATQHLSSHWRRRITLRAQQRRPPVN